MSERKLVPVSINPESLCNDCNGACCRSGTVMELSDEEKLFLEEGGANIANAGYKTRAEEEAELREVLGDKIFGSLAGIITESLENPSYLLLDPCPYLVDQGEKSICSVYQDPRKPAVCGAFKPGSPACLQMRDERYISTGGMNIH